LRIKDEFILYNTNDIKNIIKAKFKEFLWWNKELEDNIKLRYKKEVVNPNREDQKYLYVLTSLRKRIDIAKIRYILMSCIVKVSVGQFSKQHAMKEYITFMTLKGLNMKITLS
jgi:hypothetical protein